MNSNKRNKQNENETTQHLYRYVFLLKYCLVFKFNSEKDNNFYNSFKKITFRSNMLNLHTLIFLRSRYRGGSGA